MCVYVCVEGVHVISCKEVIPLQTGAFISLAIQFPQRESERGLSNNRKFAVYIYIERESIYIYIYIYIDRESRGGNKSECAIYLITIARHYSDYYV